MYLLLSQEYIEGAWQTVHELMSTVGNIQLVALPIFGNHV